MMLSQLHGWYIYIQDCSPGLCIPNPVIIGKQLLLEMNWVVVNCIIMWLKQLRKDIAFLSIFVIFQNSGTMELGAEWH